LSQDGCCDGCRPVANPEKVQQCRPLRRRRVHEARQLHVNMAGAAPRLAGALRMAER
jgi:hypothetical protein